MIIAVTVDTLIRIRHRLDYSTVYTPVLSTLLTCRSRSTYRMTSRTCCQIKFSSVTRTANALEIEKPNDSNHWEHHIIGQSRNSSRETSCMLLQRDQSLFLLRGWELVPRLGRDPRMSVPTLVISASFLSGEPHDRFLGSVGRCRLAWSRCYDRTAGSYLDHPARSLFNVGAWSVHFAELTYLDFFSTFGDW